MAAKLSHEPGPLGSQESQHELQEPQELSGSKNNDPNDTECNHLETNMLRLVQAQCNAPYNLGSPPYSRHDPEPRSTTRVKLTSRPLSLLPPSSKSGRRRCRDERVIVLRAGSTSFECGSLCPCEGKTHKRSPRCACSQPCSHLTPVRRKLTRTAAPSRTISGTHIPGR